MIGVCTLDDELITILDNYKEAAQFFGTTPDVIKVHMFRVRHGSNIRKRYKGTWVKLVDLNKILEEYGDDYDE